jgi:hypothetical protein
MSLSFVSPPFGRKDITEGREACGYFAGFRPPTGAGKPYRFRPAPISLGFMRIPLTSCGLRELLLFGGAFGGLIVVTCVLGGPWPAPIPADVPFEIDVAVGDRPT